LTNDGKGQTVHGDAIDVAGNRSSTDFGPVNLDKTKPTLLGVPADPNGAGWYSDDVTVKWVGDDALSGIDTTTQPADSVVKGEGSNLGAGPVTIKDRAGNVVDFTCTDNLSGVALCPTSKSLKGDGANQSVTSDPATDLAGNASAGKTVGGINIDGTAPSTSSNNLCTATNGYCTGSTADVVLTAADQTGLSGVKEIHYAVDGGAEQVAAGASKTVSVPLTGSGSGTVKYWAVDNAGNVDPTPATRTWTVTAPTGGSGSGSSTSNATTTTNTSSSTTIATARRAAACRNGAFAAMTAFAVSGLYAHAGRQALA
jgi:hypothetical protein